MKARTILVGLLVVIALCCGCGVDYNKEYTTKGALKTISGPYDSQEAGEKVLLLRWCESICVDRGFGLRVAPCYYVWEAFPVGMVPEHLIDKSSSVGIRVKLTFRVVSTGGSKIDHPLARIANFSYPLVRITNFEVLPDEQ